MWMKNTLVVAGHDFHPVGRHDRADRGEHQAALDPDHSCPGRPARAVLEVIGGSATEARNSARRPGRSPDIPRPAERDPRVRCLFAAACLLVDPPPRDPPARVSDAFLAVAMRGQFPQLLIVRFAAAGASAQSRPAREARVDLQQHLHLRRHRQRHHDVRPQQALLHRERHEAVGSRRADRRLHAADDGRPGLCAEGRAHPGDRARRRPHRHLSQRRAARHRHPRGRDRQGRGRSRQEVFRLQGVRPACARWWPTAARS